MDNEAGLEHLSRCTTQDVDILLIISNGLPVSLQAAFRIHELTKRLPLRIGQRYLLLNDVEGAEAARIGEKARPAGLELLGVVPSDGRLRQLSREGEPVTRLPADSDARRAMRAILTAALSQTIASHHGAEAPAVGAGSQATKP
jgi:CO dehydrogenase maturation factor